jgi:hypothetical protein
VVVLRSAYYYRHAAPSFSTSAECEATLTKYEAKKSLERSQSNEIYGGGAVKLFLSAGCSEYHLNFLLVA